MVSLDRLGALLQVREGMAVGGQGELHVLDLADAVERVEEGFQRVGQVRDASDMRRDRRQHVISRHEGAGFGIVEADVVGRVAGGVLHEPLAASQSEHVAMLDVMGHGGEERAASDRRHREPAKPLAKRRAIGRTFPRGRRRQPLERGEQVEERILGAPAILLEQLHVGAEVVDRELVMRVGRAVGMAVSGVVMAGVPVLGMSGRLEGLDVRRSVALADRGASEMEGTVGDDLGARFFVDAHGAAEMIRMRMGDEDRMDMAGSETGLFQALRDRIPGLDARESGIDDGDAVLVDHGVHIDVAQTGNPDGQLHAQDVLRDLADLRAGVFLLLAFRLLHEGPL